MPRNKFGIADVVGTVGVPVDVAGRHAADAVLAHPCYHGALGADAAIQDVVRCLLVSEREHAELRVRCLLVAERKHADLRVREERERCVAELTERAERCGGEDDEA